MCNYTQLLRQFTVDVLTFPKLRPEMMVQFRSSNWYARQK